MLESCQYFACILNWSCLLEVLCVKKVTCKIGMHTKNQLPRLSVSALKVYVVVVVGQLSTELN